MKTYHAYYVDVFFIHTVERRSLAITVKADEVRTYDSFSSTSLLYYMMSVRSIGFQYLQEGKRLSCLMSW
jgi:hypothetical protein